MTSSNFTNSRSRRRMRLRSVAVPFFLETVKPTRIGPSSSRRRPCTTKAALLTRAPLATARKSARCLNRSMMNLREARLTRSDACGPGRGARRGPCGRRSSQGGRGSRVGACAPVYWVDKSASRLFSADNLPARPTICLINEVSPPMLAGQSGPFPAQDEPPRSGPRHRGQLARLIRERPVFVNLVAHRHLPHRNTFETTKFVRIYQCLRGFSVRGWWRAIQLGYCRVGQVFDGGTRVFPGLVARTRYRAGRH